MGFRGLSCGASRATTSPSAGPPSPSPARIPPGTRHRSGAVRFSGDATADPPAGQREQANGGCHEDGALYSLEGPEVGVRLVDKVVDETEFGHAVRNDLRAGVGEASLVWTKVGTARTCRVTLELVLENPRVRQVRRWRCCRARDEVHGSDEAVSDPYLDRESEREKSRDAAGNGRDQASADGADREHEREREERIGVGHEAFEVE